mmetsp:Transcript_59730/g.109900  ORF Transcript_59730/g.109900 Transcript_59730/m.109900 type:complete len:287 (+) Transcript_59730:703-1563(+)
MRHPWTSGLWAAFWRRWQPGRRSSLAIQRLIRSSGYSACWGHRQMRIGRALSLFQTSKQRSRGGRTATSQKCAPPPPPPPGACLLELRGTPRTSPVGAGAAALGSTCCWSGADAGSAFWALPVAGQEFMSEAGTGSTASSDVSSLDVGRSPDGAAARHFGSMGLVGLSSAGGGEGEFKPAKQFAVGEPAESRLNRFRLLLGGELRPAQVEAMKAWNKRCCASAIKGETRKRRRASSAAAACAAAAWDTAAASAAVRSTAMLPHAPATLAAASSAVAAQAALETRRK